jgi:threonine synthase
VLHISTRGEAPAIGFADALLTGLARDGGLYLPRTWPKLSRKEIAGFAGRPYAAVAERLVGALAGASLPPQSLRKAARDAYAAFRHPAVCPLVQIGDNLFVLELFHGPTLAFKDVAMRLLAGLMDAALAERGQRVGRHRRLRELGARRCLHPLSA